MSEPPLFPGSICGILAGLALTLLLMARIRGEEASLRHDLEEYREYTLNVRYRHFPCIWQGRLLKKPAIFPGYASFFEILALENSFSIDMKFKIPT